MFDIAYNIAPPPGNTRRWLAGTARNHVTMRWTQPRKKLAVLAAFQHGREESDEKLAEEVGFEPTVGLHPRRFSRPVR